MRYLRFVTSPNGRGTLRSPLLLLACGSTWPMGNSPRTPSIHILDDNSLLRLFYLYRSLLLGEDDDGDRFKRGMRPWVSESWWYKLAHVCHRWRNLIFGSASFLDISFVCTNGTSVADMLAHSPPIPLVIDYCEVYGGITAEDEDGAIFALTQRHRVRCIRLFMPITNLQKLIVVIEDEYPILQHLIIWCRVWDDTTVFMFPDTLHAPHLRQLTLTSFAIPVGCRLLTAAARLVTLFLVMNSSSTYFHPNTLLQWLSFMPRLETLMISFLYTVPNPGAEIQLAHLPVMTPVTLSNLHHFWFQGHISYMEPLVHYITPCPEKLELDFFHDFSNQSMFSFPPLVRFMSTTDSENLKFKCVKFKFSERRVSVVVYPRGEAEKCFLSVIVNGLDFDWQASSVTQISNSLGQIFSAAERLTLEFEDGEDSWSSDERKVEHNGFDRIQWRRLLSSFSKAKTLCIDNGFIKGVSRCLELDDGGPPSELLPELQELKYSWNGKPGPTGVAFTSFIDARRNTGRRIILIRYRKRVINR